MYVVYHIPSGKQEFAATMPRALAKVELANPRAKVSFTHFVADDGDELTEYQDAEGRTLAITKADKELT